MSVATATLLPSPAPRRHLEDATQRAVIQYLDWALPADGIAFAIPNGGKRHPKEAARLKGLGVKAGISDICVVFRGRVFFIELKAPRGVLSPAQREMMRKLAYCDAPVMVCKSVDDVEAGLRECCVPLRGTVMAAITKTPGDGPRALQGSKCDATHETPAADLGATDAGSSTGSPQPVPDGDNLFRRRVALDGVR